MSAKTAADLQPLAIPTPDGEFVALYSETGLCGLRFPQTAKLKAGALPVSETVRTWHLLTTQALLNALAGRPPGPLPPLDLRRGTSFQQSVWKTLAAIACGCTLSYTQVAKTIGKPRAVRAVGGACGANPIPVLIPCHRVLAANHRLGGFSGGLDWKRRLLAREGLTNNRADD